MSRDDKFIVSIAKNILLKVNKEQQILQEGLETLMNHLELSKVVHDKNN